MKISTSLKLSNKLVLTVSLKQQLKLLTLNKLELKEAIQNELQENPFLEEEVYLEPDYEPEDLSKNPYEDNSWIWERKVQQRPSLIQILENQINIEFDGLEKQIALEILSNLNEKGLLDEPVYTIAKKLKISQDDVERVREKLKKLEPVGIGSISIQESLIAQYEELFGKNELVAKIIQQDIYNVNNKEYIQKKYSLSEEEYDELLCNIKTLKPYPTFGLGSDETIYIEPDVFLVEDENGYKVELNEWEIPKLKLVGHYRRLLNKKDLSEETRKFLENKLQIAIGIVKGIEQRRENIKKVVEFLARYQKDFLEKGIEFIKPLTLKDVAKHVDLHESTISRIVSNKYVLTPRGVLPLKSFFSSKLSTSSGEDVSTHKVKKLIQEIINSEDKTKPLSDEAISKLLFKNYKIRIARRTVAKYREELGIPGSRQRKLR